MSRNSNFLRCFFLILPKPVCSKLPSNTNRKLISHSPHFFQTETHDLPFLNFSTFSPSINFHQRFAIGVVLVALALFSSFLSSITNAVNALRSVRRSSASQEVATCLGVGPNSVSVESTAVIFGSVQLEGSPQK